GGGNALRAGWEAASAQQRAGAHGVRAEHAPVGPAPLAEVAAAHDPEDVGRLPGQLPHRPLEGHDLPLPYPGPEQVGREGRVAELIDVRAGVGETEGHVLVGEELADLLDVVVGAVPPK